MATFSRTTFDAASYLAFRPSYPLWVYEEVLAFHRRQSPTSLSSSAKAGGSTASHAASRSSSPQPAAAQHRVAWDLGCGPGISSLPLQRYFDSVTGLEPSANMVASAIRIDSTAAGAQSTAVQGLPKPLRDLLVGQDSDSKPLGKIEYIQGHAEDIEKHGEPGSVDLVIAGQAAHWFHYERLWPALSRVIAPGGTVAFWGYAEFSLPEHPTTAPLISAFMSDPATMGAGARRLAELPAGQGGITNVGRYFERPGRTILDRGLVDIPWPWEVDPLTETTKWDRSSASRMMHSVLDLPEAARNPDWPPLNTRSHQAQQTMDLVVSWELLDRYLRTASAVNNFQAQHPNDAAEHGGQDVVQRFVGTLKEHIGGGVDSLRLRWPLSIMMLKAAA
ncbi:hypothetical protein V8E36_005383 [Tilletia maclaganii]